MANFPVCLQWLLDTEDPKRTWKEEPDTGGRAIAGVNSKVFPADFAHIAAIPQIKRGPAITNFYLVNFWNKWFDALTSTEVAQRVFDSAVNQGPETAVKLLQLAVSVSYSHIYADGLWGPETLSTVNAAPADTLVQAFKNERIDAYNRIGGPNLEAWLARASR